MFYPHTRTRTWVLVKGNDRTPGVVPRAYRISQVLGTGAKFVQNIQKFRVRVVPRVSFCMCRTELTFSLLEVTRSVWISYRIKKYCTGFPGGQTDVVPVHIPAPGEFQKAVLVLRVLSHGREELTEAPGTGVNVVHNLQEFR